MNILIVGDSFADPKESPNYSWYHCLPGQVTNLAKAGVGQYKILEQVRSSLDHDIVLLLITSEYRIHTSQNPFYTDPTHRHYHSDLILADIESRLPDSRAEHICYWFKNIFDFGYAIDMHNLVLQETERVLNQRYTRFIPITFFPRMNNIHDFNGQLVDLSWISKTHPGSVNHLSEPGHRCVVDALKDLL